jgi:membrane-associated phospholipid phosphatase
MSSLSFFCPDLQRKSRRTFLQIGTAALLFLGLFSQCASQNDPSNLDVRIFRTINNGQSSFKSSLLGVTDYSVYPTVIAVPIGFAAYGLASDRNQEFESGALLATSEVLSYGISTLLKDGFKRDRPYEALSEVHTNHLETSDPYSFPSGHATGAFALATMLTLRYPRPEVYLPAFVWAGLVGYGRVYFGLHYPGDVLAGALIGAGSSLLVYEYRAKILPLAYKTIGRKEPASFTTMILPGRGGALVNMAVTF